MQDWQVLVIEDDPDGQEVVSTMLRYHRIPMDVVGSAEDALLQLYNKQYTGIIIDLNLPGMDGWRLLDTIRSREDIEYVPCVAITAYHSDELAVKAIEAGFQAYFPKPLEATSFVRELERVF